MPTHAAVPTATAAAPSAMPIHTCPREAPAGGATGWATGVVCWLIVVSPSADSSRLTDLAGAGVPAGGPGPGGSSTTPRSGPLVRRSPT